MDETQALSRLKSGENIDFARMNMAYFEEFSY